MSRTELRLLQGTLDVLVLKALAAGSAHGYAVAKWIRTMTDETLQIEDGALYTALHRMERRRWLKSEWGTSENNRRAKYYHLTAAGRNELEASAHSWNRYAEAVFKVLAAEKQGETA